MTFRKRIPVVKSRAVPRCVPHLVYIRSRNTSMILYIPV